MTAFASIGAATAAGFVEVVQRPGDGSYVVHLEKWMTGAPGASGYFMRAHGHVSSQAAAEAQALASLNEQRRLRYAGSSSVPGASRTVAADYPEVGTKTLDSFQTYYGSPPTGGTTLTPDVS
jgi:hypothetical protein